MTARAMKQAGLVWLIIALLNFLSQIVLRRELAPGEFGAMNTVLGLAAVLVAPLLALDFFLAHRVPAENETGEWQAVRPVLMETAAPAWGIISLALLFAALPLLALPRVSLHFFAVLVVGAALMAILSGALCAAQNRMRLWTGLLVGAAAARFLASAVLGHYGPWAQSGLGAVIVAGIVTAIPAIQARAPGMSRTEAWTFARGWKFLVPFLATVSVMLALALFTNADRVVAQAEFGTVIAVNLGYVNLAFFDDYQAAGLLGRALLWGTLPLLLVFHAQRAPLPHTTRGSLRFFWIYLGALFGGAFLLAFFAPVLSDLFSGDPNGATRFIPGFVGGMLMMGLVQGMAIFSLASRRYPECFVLGGCSIAYTILLFLFGREPQLMTSCIFGGGMISLMVVLLLGVVRYARSHP
jgi:hypothetical protein